MVYRKNVDLFKLFAPGETIKVKRSEINNFTGKIAKETLRDRKYRILEVFTHFLKCVNEYGIVECISIGELVQNGLIR